MAAVELDNDQVYIYKIMESLLPGLTLGRIDAAGQGQGLHRLPLTDIPRNGSVALPCVHGHST